MFDIIIDNDLVLNICIHVTILFTFLYIFFFSVISKTAEKVLNNQITTICNTTIPDTLASLDESKYGKFIHWDTLYDTCKDIHDHPNTEIDLRNEETNLYYKKLGLCIIIGLVLVCIGVYIHYGGNVNLKGILIENFFTFLLIGIIEYIFFQKIGKNYVPAYPTAIGGIVLERIKENIAAI